MKDLYSFDVSQKLAIEAYRQISGAYRAFFAELKLPIVVAEASSGDMGGNHSHEYHLPHSVGEDTVATCDSCGYAANDEVAGSRSPAPIDIGSALHRRSGVLRGITKDRKSLVNVWYYKAHNNITDADVNIHTIKSAVPDFDTTLTGDVHPLWQDTIEKAAKGFAPFPRMVHVVDMRLVPFFDSLSREVAAPHLEQTVVTEIEDGKGLNLSRLADGDGCPRCETGSLKIHKALELGHTFYLGTRYSEPFDARVALLKAPKEPIPIEMGCYGIGLSRLFGAIAEHLADEKGLNWPRAIAPFEVAVIPTSGIDEQTIEFYDRLSEGTVPGHNIDAVLDDRKRPFGWKMRDADVTGYPIIVILGKLWRESKTCEVQCRRLSVKENVPLDGIQGYIQSLLEKL
jgi:prolyl-tRNA synthetase